MSSLERFIRDAIEGGWNEHKAAWHNALGHNNVQCIPAVFIDPAAWRAVGKMRGWREYKEPKCICGGKTWHSKSGWHTESCPANGLAHDNRDMWKEHQHGLINAIIKADAQGIPQQDAIEKYLGEI